MDIKLIKDGDIVNFDMIKPGIFGDQYKAAIVSAVCDYNTARIVDPDINSKHANFYPFFKDSVDNVDNPNIYKYLILQLDKTVSKLVVIGFPWINQDSLKTIQTRYATVIIQNFQEYHRAPLVDFLENLGVTYQYTVSDQ
uniref:SH3 fold domain-containing protein n=1 Tax=Pantoea phage Survivor TaxID=3232176 RepID=A0AAU8L0W3_9CAUD